MRPNSITLLTDQFLGSRNGFVTYKGSSHKLIPYLSKRMGRIYVSPEDRTIILPRVAKNRIKQVKPFEKVTIGDSSRILLYRDEWNDISNLLQSSF
jgi:hypothetical protein